MLKFVLTVDFHSCYFNAESYKWRKSNKLSMYRFLKKCSNFGGEICPSIAAESNGRPQKLVNCPGTNAGVYVRKMGVDNNRKKRDLQEDETLDTSKNKKLKMGPEVEKDDALKALEGVTLGWRELVFLGSK
ncbi:uncharacterized protein LOC131657111 [Vicia villosa]|uniref:uncharacterized protein LOC131657111 n=1 Tax=Vicia villosa TaxID=3911 RepID=UPI00273B4EB1|nr:uncharacterized protein LOC131657111 [Vicia villosa]